MTRRQFKDAILNQKVNSEMLYQDKVTLVPGNKFSHTTIQVVARDIVKCVTELSASLYKSETLGTIADYPEYNPISKEINKPALSDFYKNVFLKSVWRDILKGVRVDSTIPQPNLESTKIEGLYCATTPVAADNSLSHFDIIFTNFNKCHTINAAKSCYDFALTNLHNHHCTTVVLSDCVFDTVELPVDKISQMFEELFRKYCSYFQSIILCTENNNLQYYKQLNTV